MSKKPHINFIIPLVVYPFDVMVSVGQTDKELYKDLAQYDIDDDCWHYASDTARGRACMFSSNASLLRIRKLPERADEMGNLAHEIFHIVTFVLFRIGMKLEILVSCEAYAYLTGYLTTEIYKRLNKYY